MSSTPPPYQALFEIAVATGRRLELAPMLDDCMSVYLSRLGFSGGMVFKLHSNGPNVHFKEVYSSFSKSEPSAVSEAIASQLPGSLAAPTLDGFYASLPIRGRGQGDTSFCIMPLPGFGLIAFSTSDTVVDDVLLELLAPLNRKLAQSCIACDTNEQLKNEISIRERSEKSLAESEERHRLIFNAVQAGLVIVDQARHTVVDVNDQAAQILGYTKEQLIGKKREDIFADDAGELIGDGSGPETANSSRRTTVKSVNGDIPVLETVTAVELDHRQHLLESFVDVREIAKAEEEKKRLETLLSHSQKMEALGTLAGGIAHDFNNLLTPILGLAQLCLDEPGDEEYMSENLEEIYHAGVRAKELVNQILTFSRRTEESMLPLQPKTIVRETLKLMRASLPTTIDIKRNIRSEGTVLGVPTQIQQIVMNLCTNAAHAMKHTGGVLEVLLNDIDLDDDFVRLYTERRPGRYIKLTVSDTGTGIPKAIADSIFEPYFTTKEQHEGTGLGLALVHSIVDSFRGIIRFDTEAGKGTRFEVFLPQLERREPLRSEPVYDLPTGSETILLVDDELPIVNFGKKLLSRLGYQVTVRTSSIEALGLFRKTAQRFDLVISDMTMANMTGDKLALEIKAIRPDIPVIIFTGYSDQLQAKTAADLGIEALLLKPIIAGEIAQVVRNVLDAKAGLPTGQVE